MLLFARLLSPRLLSPLVKATEQAPLTPAWGHPWDWPVSIPPARSSWNGLLLWLLWHG